MQSKKKGTSSEAQSVINLFQSLPLEVQSEFMEWLKEKEIFTEFDFKEWEVEPLDNWEVEVNDFDCSVTENYFEEPIQIEPKKINSKVKTRRIKLKNY